MKKLLFVFLLLIGVVGAILVYFFYPTITLNQPKASDKQDENSKTQNEEILSLLDDKDLVPYTDLPNYVYGSQEISLSNNNQKIYGQCLIPEGTDSKVPLVICCHGLGADFISCLDYGRIFAQKGLAAYTFDFRGGGGTKSEGLSTDMSVMTEVSDLEVVLENAKTWDFVDTDKIILFGESQGGLVSAITAARHPNDIAGLILEYPAFVIGDTIHSIVQTPEALPESYSLGGITIGPRYVHDMWNYDAYSEIANYKKRVLILQGSEDKVVPVEYSDKAAQTYPDAEYYVISGAEHGFVGEAFEKSLTYIFDYLERIRIIRV